MTTPNNNLITPSIAEWDYLAPLDPLDSLPPISALQRLYSCPVRRARFIHALCQGHTATWAARYGGNSREQYYAWKTEYPDFAAAWQNAVDGAGGDIWEDRLLAISQQDTQLNAAGVATIVGLKMHKRFIENAPGGTGAPVQVQVINVVLPPGAPVPQSLPGAGTIDLLPPP